MSPRAERSETRGTIRNAVPPGKGGGAQPNDDGRISTIILESAREVLWNPSLLAQRTDLLVQLIRNRRLRIVPIQ